jgi:hypothetical protein
MHCEINRTSGQFAAFVKNAHGHRVYLNGTARKLIKGVPRAGGGCVGVPEVVPR